MATKVQKFCVYLYRCCLIFGLGAQPLPRTIEHEPNKDKTIAVAATLFLGYIDAATTIAKTHGCGGGPSDDWGRKKNEDDLTFMGRCLIMAIQMMKPSRSARRGMKL